MAERVGFSVSPIYDIEYKVFIRSPESTFVATLWSILRCFMPLSQAMYRTLGPLNTCYLSGLPGLRPMSVIPAS